MDIILPNPEAGRFNGDLRWLFKIRQGARARYNLAGIIEDAVAEQIGIVDWTRKDDVKREMWRKIKRHLTASGYMPEYVELLAQTILHLLQVRDGG